MSLRFQEGASRRVVPFNTERIYAKQLSLIYTGPGVCGDCTRAIYYPRQGVVDQILERAEIGELPPQTTSSHLNYCRQFGGMNRHEYLTNRCWHSSGEYIRLPTPY